jgi:hypothetical protein
VNTHAALLVCSAERYRRDDRQSWEQVVRNYFESLQYEETIALLRNGVREPFLLRWFPETLSSPGKSFQEPLRQCAVWGNHYLVQEWCEATTVLSVVHRNP